MGTTKKDDDTDILQLEMSKSGGHIFQEKVVCGVTPFPLLHVNKGSDPLRRRKGGRMDGTGSLGFGNRQKMPRQFPGARTPLINSSPIQARETQDGTPHSRFAGTLEWGARQPPT